jgi:hypothetical protein
VFLGLTEVGPLDDLAAGGRRIVDDGVGELQVVVADFDLVGSVVAGLAAGLQGGLEIFDFHLFGSHGSKSFSCLLDARSRRHQWCMRGTRGFAFLALIFF